MIEAKRSYQAVPRLTLEKMSGASGDRSFSKGVDTEQ
jgi:hypothetical protein